MGFPITGTEILILDRENKPLRSGLREKLQSGPRSFSPVIGASLTQSAAKFRPDPDDPTRKVFCTGDLGYFLPDGQLVFLGRKDFRVKIRGFSVDLASVESALMGNPQVKRAVVLALVDPGGHKRLVAYIVTSPGSTLTSSSLRAFLLERIPAYMIPLSAYFYPNYRSLQP